MRGEALEMANGEVQLASVFLRHRRDCESLLAVMAERRNEAFLAESVERGTNRSAADAEPLGDDAFGEWAARRQLTPHDQLTQLLERVVRVVGFRSAWRRALARARRGPFPRF
jgi:hypothetical protein